MCASAYRIRELCVPKEGLQEAEEGEQQPLEGRPALLSGGEEQQRHEGAVAHKLQPGEAERREGRGMGGGDEGGERTERKR